MAQILMKYLHELFPMLFTQLDLPLKLLRAVSVSFKGSHLILD